ncbi:MAG TPA: hypothetical protein V6D28_30375 [Leptolyngbyaceae cyanobacterium]
MSFDEQNLEAFIELLNDKRSSLFSARDRADLAELIAPLPDDIEKLSIAIASWYEKRPKILDAQLDLINKNLTSQRVPGSTSGNIKLPETELNKEVLRNAIQQSSQIRKPPSPPTQK